MVCQSPIIELHDLRFAWPKQDLLLDIAEFTVQPQQRVFLKGPSGSGKTTLLGLLGGVQLPQSGCIKLLGQDLSQLSANARDRFRVDHSGFIFQQFNLLPFLSVLDNVVLPCQFSKLRKQRASIRHGSIRCILHHTHICFLRQDELQTHNCVLIKQDLNVCPSVFA